MHWYKFKVITTGFDIIHDTFFIETQAASLEKARDLVEKLVYGGENWSKVSYIRGSKSTLRSRDL